MVSPRHLSPAALVLGSLVLCALPAHAQEAAKPTGLWLTTNFPVLTEQIGQQATLSLDLANAAMPPARVSFEVAGLPSGWTWQLLGDGKPVKAAIAGPDQNRQLQLKLTPPDGEKPGDLRFTVNGHTDNGQTLSLPIEMTMAAAKPDALTLKPTLPALRGTPKSSFDYDVAIHNDSTEDNTVNLISQTPPGFSAVFKEQYGSNELSSLPLKAGETKTVKVSVKPPHDVSAGQYPVSVAASDPKAQGKTQLVLDITGQAGLTLASANERLSGSAEAGKDSTFDFEIANSGSAPAENVSVSANAPSGWKVSAKPDSIPELGPGENTKVALTLTPSDKAIAGDYMVDVHAKGDGLSDSQQFRVSVTTSTLWGAAGLAIIAAAVIVLGFSVTRYGRR
ncbi:NEW3 domain-containing protein [Rhizobium halophytocola]|uniref:Membrane protein n=1 Tax=Rhizobium halophytocola TaxID=735519 RepID=A0ABS4E6F3_9HYPH|nr:NEW3 domain-containing protein [Rhizobium halophytocola]MBP1853533.1 putative membrane protein [Rhizobium halophytocola]